MEKQLYDAAVEGNKISLLHLLQQDKLLFDRFVTGRYRETPLHVAAILGHSEFVDEVLTHRPELARELNSRKSSPLHLAAAKGYLEIVKRLLEVNPDICHDCDLDGRNPLHIAAMKGHLDVLKELVIATPWAARSLMEDDETILHACVRYNQLEALKFLVEGVLSDLSFVNCQNRDGNTILDLAKAANQTETISFLKSREMVGVNCQNKESFTVRQLLPQFRRGNLLNLLSIIMLPVSGLPTKINRFFMWILKVTVWVAITAMTLAYLQSFAALAPDTTYWTAVNCILIIAALVWLCGLPLTRLFFLWVLVVVLWVSIDSMTFAYDQQERVPQILKNVIFVLVLIGFMLLLLLVYTIRLIITLIKCLLRLVKRLIGI